MVSIEQRKRYFFTFTVFAGWLKLNCQVLGLNRYLLPHPLLRHRHDRYADAWVCGDEPGQTRLLMSVGQQAGAANHQQDEVGDCRILAYQKRIYTSLQMISVGPPLVRPPDGWDNPDFNRLVCKIRVDHHLANAFFKHLWAYGNQPLNEIERNLAPTQVPSFCGLRCAVLVLVSWIACVVGAVHLLVPALN
jgi:hypothetical protein